ncbi:thioredoxin-disulfide reductase [Buchnera aphidicola (Mindarus keteleerifoliae)]|uniref:thioredoxin-disulfide reductase n=1 Tax=Buchnera aphidicola TaxID=9 RepID=UPI0031B731DD
MKLLKKRKIIIIGSGPAGYTASIYAARANLKPTLITGIVPGGQLTKTENIENWPGDINSIPGTLLMDRMKNHSLKFNSEIISDNILSVDFKSFPFKLFGEEYNYSSSSVIIATGASARYLNIKSEKKFLGKGISTCAICDGFFYKDKEIAVIGGGNTAIEEALYLSNIASKVYLIHRGSKFTAEKILVDRLNKKIQEKKIFTYMNHSVKKFVGNNIELKEIKIISTKENLFTSRINVSGAFICIGNIPNTKMFKKQLQMNNGYIKTNFSNFHGYKTQTNIKGVFAAGDVTDHIYRQAITSSASGCMAAIDAEKYLQISSI